MSGLSLIGLEFSEGQCRLLSGYTDNNLLYELKIIIIKLISHRKFTVFICFDIN